jgi:hypothetical protein
MVGSVCAVFQNNIIMFRKRNGEKVTYKEKDKKSTDRRVSRHMQAGSEVHWKQEVRDI